MLLIVLLSYSWTEIRIKWYKSLSFWGQELGLLCLWNRVVMCLEARAPNSNPVLLITSCVVLNKSLNLSIPGSSYIKRIRLESSSWNHCKEQIRYLEKCLAHNYYKYVNYYQYHPPPHHHHLNPLKAYTTVSTI